MALLHPKQIAQASGASGRKILGDSNTRLLYTLDETGTPWANTGAAGALNLTAASGGDHAPRAGVFGYGLSFENSSGAGITSGNTSTGEASTWTASLWVKLRAYNPNALFLTKMYRNDGTYNDPYIALAIAQHNSAAGQWIIAISVAATDYYLDVTAVRDVIRLEEWTMLAGTWDGTTLKAYKNGDLVNSSTPATGNTDYGTSGPWVIGGGATNVPSRVPTGIIDDVRFENTVRTQAFLHAQYSAGMGLGSAGY